MCCLDIIQRLGAQEPCWGRKTASAGAELAAGGPATGAAVTAAALLGRATLITAVGDDPGGDLIRADLASYGVTLIDCAPPGFSLPVATCLVHPDGERTVISSRPSGTPATLNTAAQDAIRGAAGLLLDGHHPTAAEQALDLCPPEAVTVLDAGSAKAHTRPWLPRLDVIAGSADYAAGLGLDLDGAVEDALAAGARSAVMTDGPRPVRYAGADRRIHEIRPPVVEAVDSLGAGDAFHGALVAHLAHHERPWDLGDAVAAAVSVAAARVTHRGPRRWLASLHPLDSVAY